MIESMRAYTLLLQVGTRKLWISDFRLSTLDVEFMKNLGSRVNIIPVIGKADTLTEEELTGFKARVITL